MFGQTWARVALARATRLPTTPERPRDQHLPHRLRREQVRRVQERNRQHRRERSRRRGAPLPVGSLSAWAGVLLGALGGITVGALAGLAGYNTYYGGPGGVIMMIFFGMTLGIFAGVLLTPSPTRRRHAGREGR